MADIICLKNQQPIPITIVEKKSVSAKIILHRHFRIRGIKYSAYNICCSNLFWGKNDRTSIFWKSFCLLAGSPQRLQIFYPSSGLWVFYRRKQFHQMFHSMNLIYSSDTKSLYFHHFFLHKSKLVWNKQRSIEDINYRGRNLSSSHSKIYTIVWKE